MIEDWCAQIFQHHNYDGWDYMLYETDKGYLSGTDYDNKVSSIKIREGCILKGYDDDDLNNFIFGFNKDKPKLSKLDGNELLTSYSCKCNGKYIDYQTK